MVNLYYPTAEIASQLAKIKSETYFECESKFTSYHATMYTVCGQLGLKS